MEARSALEVLTMKHLFRLWDHGCVPEFKYLRRNQDTDRNGSPVQSHTWNPIMNELTEYKRAMSSKPRTLVNMNTEGKVDEEEPDAEDGPGRRRTGPHEE